MYWLLKPGKESQGWLCEMKPRAAAGQFWAVSAANTAHSLCSSPAPQGPGLHSKVRVRALDKLAEKIQKRELHKFTFYSCFTVVKRTGSAQLWEQSWVQGSDRLQRSSSQSSPGCQQAWFFSNISYPMILSSPGFVCLDLGWSKL